MRVLVLVVSSYVIKLDYFIHTSNYLTCYLTMCYSKWSKLQTRKSVAHCGIATMTTKHETSENHWNRSRVERRCVSVSLRNMFGGVCGWKSLAD